MNDAKFLTPEVLNFFIIIAKDAGNWSGTPLVGGNYNHTKIENGYLTNLKKAGLVETFHADGFQWIMFTDDGKAAAAKLGIEL